jgi:vacuolar-type H+-ATPase subunit E/Vma4
VSIDALLEQLERDAQAEAVKLVSAAQKRAQEILSRADAETQRRRTEALGRLEEAGRRAVAGETASAVRRFRELRLRERAEVLDRIFSEAERGLRTSSADRYQRLLPGLMRATLRFLEGTPAVVHCRPEIAAQVEQLRAEHTDVTVRPSVEAAAGILGESADGAVAVDNTLPALLWRRRAELAIAVAARLEAT